MANYSTLKAAVADVVKTNGTKAITGANLQTVLLSIINSIGGGGYIFEGVATPSTNAGTPDQNVFYIGGAGTYANFGTSVVVPPTNIAVFKYNGTWTCEQVTVENGGVFDISAFHAVGGKLATYAELAAALGTGGANVPEGVRKGGMSIKYVQSSDNKYVQYFCNFQTFTTDVIYWEKINLENEIFDIKEKESTVVKLYSVIASDFKIQQHGNGADVYSCSIEEGKRYKIRFYPIFSSSNDSSTYTWAVTNVVDTIDSQTVIASSELYTEHFNGPWTEIELVAPQYAKTFYVLSSRTPIIIEHRDLAANTTDNLNSFCGENALSANAGRLAAYKANNNVLGVPSGEVCNGKAVVHIDISNVTQNSRLKEKNFGDNYFVYSFTNVNTDFFASPVFHPTGRNMIHIKFRIETERIGSASNNLIIYYADGTAPSGDVQYHSFATITEDGEYDLTFDPAYLTIYEHWENFYLWFWVNGSITAAQKLSFKFYNFQVVEYDSKESYRNISGDTVKELFHSADEKLTEISSEINHRNQIFIAPNGSKYVVSVANNGSIISIPVIPSKATIFGNSLVSGFTDSDAGVSFGMCASAKEKDFKTLFYNYLLSVNPSFVGEKYGAAAFETISDVNNIDYAIAAYFLPALTGSEELVIIELGDNVSVANESVFAQSSVALLQAIRAKCPNARVVWLGIWYGRTSTYNSVRNACKVSGSELISLADIVTGENRGYIGEAVYVGLGDRTISNVTNVTENTSTNITISFEVNGVAFSTTMDVVSYSLSSGTLSYRGNYDIVTAQGVASHPGDRGMKAIANKLLYELGIVNDAEYYQLD